MRRSRILVIGIVVAVLAAIVAVMHPWADDGAPNTSVRPERVSRAETSRPRPPEAPAPTPAPPVAPASLHGRVVRAGQPAAGVKVTARDNGVFVEAQTADDGTFAFDALPPGRFLVGAIANTEASPLVGPIALGPGQRRDDVVLELLRGASVSGTVQDVRTGRAIANAHVRSSSGATVTDDAGRFQLGPLPYGGTFVEASAPGYESRVQWLSLDAAREYSGLQLFLRGATVLRGRVTRLGQPVPNASVWAEKGYLTTHVEQFGPTFTSGDGSFALDVASGEVQLAAAGPGGARVSGPHLTVAEGGTYDALQIELGEALRATGKVTINGAPAEGVGLYLLDARTEQATGMAVSGPGGAFTFEGIPTGSYLVQVNSGAAVAQRGPFEVTGPDDAAWTVDVTTSRVLAGHVLPARAGVIVRWRSSDWAGPLAAETATDVNGAFSFTGVPDGALTVEAEADSAFARSEANAGDKEVTLHLESSSVTGVVVDASGRAVTDFLVRAVPAAGGVPRLRPVLNPNGEFSLTLAPGRYELFASASGSGESPSGVPVVVESGRVTSNVRITLAAEGRIAGVVVAQPKLDPLEGVEISVVRGRGGQAAGYERLGAFTSDAEGHFEFSGVPPNAWVTFRKYGFKPFTGTPAMIRDRFHGLIGLYPGTPTESQQPPAPYEGVGMQLQPDTRSGVLVAGVFDGSPAQAAGVLPQDEIVAVDGAPVAGLPLDQVIARITGPSGTTVRVTFRRAGATFELVLRRRTIQL